MFTGIVEATGKVINVKREKDNIHFFIQAPFTHEIKIDQSISHNGACMTVVEISQDIYSVTAIKETLSKTNLSLLKTGSLVNLERCMRMNGRLDGHMVQGHIDQTAVCEKITEENGSWKFFFSYDPALSNITVEKGSICVNGVSLTVTGSGKAGFSVAVIPYTFENTNFHLLKEKDIVNLEFDIIGKYITKLFSESRS